MSDNTKKNTEHSKEIIPVRSASPDLVLASDMLPSKIAIVPLQSRPAFPGVMLPMIYSPGPYAEMFKNLAKEGAKGVVGLLMTKAEEMPEDPKKIIESLFQIGTVARVVNVNETPDGPVQVLLQGMKRFKALNFEVDGPYIRANVTFPKTAEEDSDKVKALTMGIVNTLRELVKHNPIFSQEIKMFLSRGSLGDPALLADFAANMTTANREALQEALECVKLLPRLEKVLYLLRKEQDLNELKEKITKQIEEKISKQQREFFLKEQLKAIKEELGLEKDEKTEEIEKYQALLKKLKPSDEAKKVIDEEIDKLKILSEHSPEYAVSRNYLDWLSGLPWGLTTRDKLSVAKARRVLNRDHYGLDDVKERILEFIGVSKLKGSVEGSILCLIGPPGVGKTSLGKAVAESLGRKFFRFSLGGMRDEAEIKGHRRTYIGALPGKVIQAVKNCGSQNPVIMLDEIDKVGASFRGDPASALLEVLDPEQNATFRDHFLDVAFDLSKVLFIATANVPDTIPGPLLDRMEVIKLSGYIAEEKVQIAKRHLIPKLLERSGLTKEQISFTDAGIRRVIDEHAREAGVRALEKSLNACMRKVASEIAEKKRSKPCRVTANNLEDLLGKPKFHDNSLVKNPNPGVVTGLAWTALGGSTLYIESIAVPGKYGLKQTGQLGAVMVESSNIAFSYVTSRVADFGAPKTFFDKRQIHLHVPAGATPKDGPSAGVTMATSLISLARVERVSPEFAMTGELTLTGQVLPVGGIKEKLIAAKRSNVIKQMILPAENQKDFEEIPDKVKEGVTPHFVSHYEEIFKLVFE